MEGGEFKSLRVAAGWSQKTCAEFFGTSISVVQRWDRGLRESGEPVVIPSHIADELRTVVLKRDLEMVAKLIERGVVGFIWTACAEVAGTLTEDQEGHWRLNQLLAACAVALVDYTRTSMPMYIDERTTATRTLVQRLRRAAMFAERGIIPLVRDPIREDDGTIIAR